MALESMQMVLWKNTKTSEAAARRPANFSYNTGHENFCFVRITAESRKRATAMSQITREKGWSWEEVAEGSDAVAPAEIGDFTR
jgi:hypothetical protein